MSLDDDCETLQDQFFFTIAGSRADRDFLIGKIKGGKSPILQFVIFSAFIMISEVFLAFDVCETLPVQIFFGYCLLVIRLRTLEAIIIFLVFGEFLF